MRERERQTDRQTDRHIQGHEQDKVMSLERECMYEHMYEHMCEWASANWTEKQTKVAYRVDQTQTSVEGTCMRDSESTTKTFTPKKLQFLAFNFE